MHTCYFKFAALKVVECNKITCKHAHQSLDVLVLVTWNETAGRESRDGFPCWRWLWDSGLSSRCRGYSCHPSTPRTCGKTERRPRTWQSARLSGTDWLQTFSTRCGELSHLACWLVCLRSNPENPWSVHLQNTIKTVALFWKFNDTNHIWYFLYSTIKDITYKIKL